MEKLILPPMVPFDAKGDMIWMDGGADIVVGMINQETGRIFYPGQDYDIPTTRGSRMHESDSVREAMSRAIPLFAEPEYVAADPFVETLFYFGKDDLGGRGIWRNRHNKRYSMFLEQHQEACEKLSSGRIHGRWEYVSKYLPNKTTGEMIQYFGIRLLEVL